MCVCVFVRVMIIHLESRLKDAVSDSKVHYFAAFFRIYFE